MITPFTFESDLEENYLQRQYLSRGICISAQISDIHMGAINPKTQYDIIRDQVILELYKLPRLDVVSINGDFYDHKTQKGTDMERYSNMLAQEFVNLCRAKQATLIIIQGTEFHDSNQLRSFSNYLVDNSIDIRIVERIQFEYVRNCRFLCIPELYHVDESVYRQVLDYSGIYDMALMHGTIAGSVYGDTVGNGRLFHIEDFHNCVGPIFAGHIHTPGCFNRHFYYCGAPIRYQFGQEEDKGFYITCMNLDTGMYDITFKKVQSFTYTTFTLNDLKYNDPKDIINHIDTLKRNHNIDFIRIKFDIPIPNTDRVILNNYYRNMRNYTIQYMDIEQEKMKKDLEANSELKEFAFITDHHYSDEEKFVMYCNKMVGGDDIFITVEELRAILEEELTI